MIQTKSDKIIKHDLRVIKLLIKEIYEVSDTQDMFLHDELEKINNSINYLNTCFERY